MASLWLASQWDYLSQLSIFPAGIPNTYMHQYPHTHTNEEDTVSPENYMMIRGFPNSSGHEEGGAGGKESFLSSDITTDPSKGGMCCRRKAEEIGQEHAVAKINSKAAVWKASFSFSLPNPYWHLKSNFRVHTGNEKGEEKKKKSGPSLTCQFSFMFESQMYKKFKKAIVTILNFSQPSAQAFANYAVEHDHIHSRAGPWHRDDLSLTLTSTC